MAPYHASSDIAHPAQVRLVRYNTICEKYMSEIHVVSNTCYEMLEISKFILRISLLCRFCNLQSNLLMWSSLLRDHLS